MEEQESARRRFGADFVAAHYRRFGKRPPEQRQLTYDIAIADGHEPWRRWLDDQLALMPASAGDALARRIWLDEHFWSVNFELAAGAGLRAAGLTVAYEREWGGLTPDWTVLSEDGRPIAFVEVHTDQPPADTFGQMRAWHGLVERVKAVPVPVVLQVASRGGPVPPPNAGQAKRIAQDLKNKLLKTPPDITIWSNGYTFLVMADPTTGGQMKSPLGMHACFEPPSCRAGPVSADQIMERIQEKTHRYRQLAASYGVALIVAVGAHRFTGVTLQQLDDRLTGLPAPKMAFQFNLGDPFIPSQTVTFGPVSAWQWPEGLDGILWIENQLPFPVTARPNPASQRQIPLVLNPS